MPGRGCKPILRKEIGGITIMALPFYQVGANPFCWGKCDPTMNHISKDDEEWLRNICSDSFRFEKVDESNVSMVDSENDEVTDTSDTSVNEIQSVSYRGNAKEHPKQSLDLNVKLVLSQKVVRTSDNGAHMDGICPKVPVRMSKSSSKNGENEPSDNGAHNDGICNEYKIIRLICRKLRCVVSVFTFKVGIWAQENVNLKGIEGTWRDVEKPKVLGFEETYYVLVNGVTHWLGFELKGVAVCFDLKDERFYEMQLPVLDFNYVCHLGEVRVSLGDLGGLFSLFYMFQAKEVDIWVMGEYGVVGSWTKLFKVGQNEMCVSFEFLHPIGLAKSGEIIIRKDYGQLLLYDPNQNSVIECKLKSEFMFHDIFSYVGSLLTMVHAVAYQNT
ncbi:hypothetical protein IFM89_000664 [Coptis chinensis]|uniref:F-box associated beta-propeller type 1 domain-containing protein n=1 Tax=Coptis chinensis TaxID=261450 RepID=A0A835IHU8_9MAGN|nr:hypothetical protein IFM89_000664 [Coptis chinensis]